MSTFHSRRSRHARRFTVGVALALVTASVTSCGDGSAEPASAPSTTVVATVSPSRTPGTEVPVTDADGRTCGTFTVDLDERIRADAACEHPHFWPTSSTNGLVVGQVGHDAEGNGGRVVVLDLDKDEQVVHQIDTLAENRWVTGTWDGRRAAYRRALDGSPPNEQVMTWALGEKKPLQLSTPGTSVDPNVLLAGGWVVWSESARPGAMTLRAYQPTTRSRVVVAQGVRPAAVVGEYLLVDDRLPSGATPSPRRPSAYRVGTWAQAAPPRAVGDFDPGRPLATDPGGGVAYAATAAGSVNPNGTTPVAWNVMFAERPDAPPRVVKTLSSAGEPGVHLSGELLLVSTAGADGLTAGTTAINTQTGVTATFPGAVIATPAGRVVVQREIGPVQGAALFTREELLSQLRCG